ncbi:S-adenosyl-L-methionine-dependent methyltransferase [Paxillus ammoniavirescens]|nr:S-adenosyl-L-methionine-dependent methyltransferase [Paxillus ammoniavirescens]
MPGEAQLEALLEIITTSARQAIEEYKRHGNGVDVPTIQSVGFHPLDFKEDTVALKKAVRSLEGACQQLCASLAPPQHTVVNFTQTFDWACTEVALRGRVADVLADHPKGLNVEQLASIISVEKGKLGRILRSLATKGCFTEVDENVFANNRLSLILKSTSNVGCLAKIYAQDTSQGACVLYETMTEPDYAWSHGPDKAPMIYALRKQGIKGNFFDWMKADDERRENYHRAMIGAGDIMGSLSVLHHYPWAEVKTVCDVGASVGTFSVPLSKTFPHLKITDQDLPEVLVQAKQVWAKGAPEAVEEDRIEFVPLNFLEESPVKGKDIYYLRNILHDWPDVEAAVIMRNVRDAMGPHSRLLIHDYVMASACRKTQEAVSGTDIAPEPMLPNFGAGNSRMYNQDLSMWFVHNGKERTVKDLVALGSATGLRLVEVYDLVESSVVEFRLL